MKQFKCLRCNHVWAPYSSDPKICPKCKSKLWNVLKSKANSSVNLRDFLKRNTKAPLVFAILVAQINKYQITPKQKLLAKILGTTQSNVSRQWKLLESAGLISGDLVRIDKLFDYFTMYLSEIKLNEVSRKNLRRKSVARLYHKYLQEQKLKPLYKDPNKTYSPLKSSRSLIENDFSILCADYFYCYVRTSKVYTFNQLFEIYSLKFVMRFEFLVADLERYRSQFPDDYNIVKRYIDGFMAEGEALHNFIYATFPSILTNSSVDLEHAISTLLGVAEQK